MTRLALAPLPLSLLLAAAACGCRPDPLPEPELRGRLTALAAERGAFTGISSAYELSMAGERPDGRGAALSCSGRLVAARGRGLRMQGEKALGMAKIFDLLLAGDSYRLNFIHGKKFFVGSVTRALARRKAEQLTGGVRPDLAALLFPVPPLEGEGAPQLVYGGRESRLVWPTGSQAGRREVFIDSAYACPLRTEFFDAQGRRLAVLYYRRPVDCGGFHPVGGFKLRGAAGRRFRLDMSFSKIRLNPEVRDAVFNLPVPPGIKVTDVDAEKPGEPGEPAGSEVK
jgi:hypothetical protein